MKKHILLILILIMSGCKAHNDVIGLSDMGDTVIYTYPQTGKQPKAILKDYTHQNVYLHFIDTGFTDKWTRGYNIVNIKHVRKL